MNVRVGEKLDIYCPQSSNLEEPLFLKVNITSGLNRMLSDVQTPPWTTTTISIPGNQNLKARSYVEMVDSKLILWEFWKPQL